MDYLGNPAPNYGIIVGSNITNNIIQYTGVDSNFTFTLVKATNMDKSVVTGNLAQAINVSLTNWVTWATYTSGSSTVANNQQ